MEPSDQLARLEQQVTELRLAVQSTREAVAANTAALHGDPQSGHPFGLLRQIDTMKVDIGKLNEQMDMARERDDQERAVRAAIEAERLKWLKVLGILLGAGQTAGLALIVRILQAVLGP